MGGSAKTTTEQQRTPFEPTVKPLTSLVGQVNNLDSSIFQNPFSQTTQDGLNSMEALARQGGNTNQAIGFNNSLFGGGEAGLEQLMATANGDNLGGNPYLEQLLDQQSQSVSDRVNQHFSAAGRYASDAHGEALTRELGNLDTQIRYGDYQNERQNQLNAASTIFDSGQNAISNTPGLDAARYADAQTLTNVGRQRDEIEQANNRTELDEIRTKLGLLMPVAGAGGTSVNTQEQQQSLFNQIAGGALGIGSLMMGNPMGAAGIGGLFGGGGGNVALNPWTATVARA